MARTRRTVGVILGITLLSVPMIVPATPAQTRTLLQLSDPMWIGPSAIATAVDASGQSAFAVSSMGQLIRIDVDSKKISQTTEVRSSGPGAQSGAMPIEVPRAIAVDQKSGRLLVPSQIRPLILVYDPSTLTLIDEFLVGVSGFSAIDLSSEGSMFVGTNIASYDGLGQTPGMILEVDSNTGSVLWSSKALPAAVLELDIDHRGEQAFYIGHDGVLRQVSLVTSETRVALPNANQSALGVEVDEQSRRLYVAMPSGVHVVDADSLEVLFVWRNMPRVVGVALVSDRGVAYVAQRQRLNIVDLRTGEVITSRRIRQLGLGWGFGQYFQTNGRLPALAFIENLSTVRLADFDALPPSPPRAVRTRVSSGSVSISWTPPAYRGEPPLSRYVVSVGDDRPVCRTTQTSCRVSRQSVGALASVEVYAESPSGRSEPGRSSS